MEGLPEVVEEGESGFLADVGDIETMAAAGALLLKDIGAWRRHSAAARAGAERFKVERVVPLYEEFYDRVLAENGAEVAGVSSGRAADEG